MPDRALSFPPIICMGIENYPSELTSLFGARIIRIFAALILIPSRPGFGRRSLSVLGLAVLLLSGASQGA